MPLATVTLTDAEMKSLNSTPVQLIAAPGAGKRLIIVRLGGTCNTTTNGGTGVNGTVRYSVVNVNLFTFTMISAGVNGPREITQDATTFSTINNVLTNRAVEIVGSENAGGTFASTDGFHIAVLYEEMDDPN